jgi:hypothetical protein
MKALLAIILALTITLPIVAQEQKPTSSKVQKTKIETFEAKTGAVIIIGDSAIGSISAKNPFSLSDLPTNTASVECREFTDASSGTKEYGIFITIYVDSNSEYAYIDYDEIDSLEKGIDYIIKLDKNITKLDTFEADYTTRGGFTVSNLNNDFIALKSGRFAGASAYFSLEDCTKFKSLIQTAKVKLDSIRPDHESKP